MLRRWRRRARSRRVPDGWQGRHTWTIRVGPRAPPSGRGAPRDGLGSRPPATSARRPRPRPARRPAAAARPGLHRRWTPPLAPGTGERTATAAAPLSARAPSRIAYGQASRRAGPSGSRAARAFASPVRRSSTRPVRASPIDRSSRSAPLASRSPAAGAATAARDGVTSGARGAHEVLDQVVGILQPDRDAHRPGRHARRRRARHRSWRCDELAGWLTSVSTLPRLVAWTATRHAPRKRSPWGATAREVDSEHPARHPVAKDAQASSCCGCEASPG